jgi:hypothetical protein
MSELSGTPWVRRFPTSTSTGSLTPVFRVAVDNFVSTLKTDGASVSVAATLRPPERVYLMHYAWRIARENMSPAHVPTMPGVLIDWNHGDAGASRIAASKMVAAYGIVFKPSLASRHTKWRAIDMTITNYAGKTFKPATGEVAVVVHAEKELFALGAAYGVYKLLSDPPHWSDDGH